MSRQLLLVVSAIVASVVISNNHSICVCASRLLVDYVDQPINGLYLHGYKLIKEVSESVEEIDDLIKILHSLKSNLTDKDSRLPELVVVTILSDLSKEVDYYTCYGETINHYIGLANYVFRDLNILVGDTVDHHIGLFKFLKSNARKFNSCVSKKAIASLNENYSMIAKSVEEFDELVEANARKGDRVDTDEELAKLAESLDVIQGKFRAHKMLRVANKYFSAGLDNLNISRSRVLLFFISRTCSTIRQYPFKNLYNAYSLTKFISPNNQKDLKNIPTKYAKLVEYSRVCLQFLNPNTRPEFEKSVQNSFAFKLPKYFSCISGNQQGGC